jgi:malonate transporter
MNHCIHSLNAVGPVFLIIMLGYWLRRRERIDEAFIRMSSRLIFTIALPSLIFIKIAETDFLKIWDSSLILLIVAGTVVFIAAVWIAATLFIRNLDNRAVFIQGSFRSNIAIVGLAIIASGFSSNALTYGTVMLAFLMPLYNIISVVILAMAHHRKERNPHNILHGVVSNPLIIAAFGGLLISFLKIPIPLLLTKTVSSVGAIALPLALINIGATLHAQGNPSEVRLAWIASTLKTVVIPAGITLTAYHLGFRGEKLAALFIIFGSPTAVASYIMAQGFGCNHRLAGAIVTCSTLSSMFTQAVGIYILKSAGWI